MATIRLPNDFKEFLRLLNGNSVEYLIIGGYAIGYYGYPRATGDMDIWVGMSPANIEKLQATLNAFGFSAPADFTMRESDILRLGVPPLRIEVMAAISGVDFASAHARRTVASLDGVEVPLIGLEDLKVNKRASGRLKDLNDLEELP